MSSVISTSQEVYRYRALLVALTQRHLATRYRGSLLGFLWSILNPLCLMLVYVLVFSYYMRSNAVEHYPIFLFCGLLPWVWTSSALSECASSIVSSGHLITKSLFPAQVLPCVSVATSLVNFLLSLPLLFIFMLVAGVPSPGTAVLLPALLLVHALFLLGLGLILSALNVLYRDVQHLLGNLLSFLFFLSPIVYPASVVPPRLAFTLTINPFALFTEAYHAILFRGEVPSLMTWGLLSAWGILSLLIGNAVFSRYRETFAELL